MKLNLLQQKSLNFTIFFSLRVLIFFTALILLGNYKKKSDLNEDEIHCCLRGMDMEQKI